MKIKPSHKTARKRSVPFEFVKLRTLTGCVEQPQQAEFEPPHKYYLLRFKISFWGSIGT